MGFVSFVGVLGTTCFGRTHPAVIVVSLAAKGKKRTENDTVKRSRVKEMDFCHTNEVTVQ